MNRNYFKQAEVFSPEKMKFYSPVLFQSTFYNIITDAIADCKAEDFLTSGRRTSNNVRVSDDCSMATILLATDFGASCTLQIEARWAFTLEDNFDVIVEKHNDGKVMTCVRQAVFSGTISWSAGLNVSAASAPAFFRFYTRATAILELILARVDQFLFVGVIEDTRPCEECDPKGTGR